MKTGSEGKWKDGIATMFRFLYSSKPLTEVERVLEEYFQDFPDLAYHNLEHTWRVMDLCSRCRITSSPTDVISGMFHDFVYVPGQRDNEEKSYLKRKQLLTPLGRLTPHDSTWMDYVGPVESNFSDCIVATMTHRGFYENTRCFLDIDLVILGTCIDHYTGYCRAIREEFHEVPDEVYREGRKGWIESFLGREVIYQTNTFKGFEGIARDNLAKELQALKEGTWL